MPTAAASKRKTKLNLQPLGDRIVIERDDAEERTAGGIVLPDSAKEKVNRGRVAAVGPGRLDDNGNRVPPQVKVGDHVLMNKYGGDDFTIGEEEFLLIREDGILAVIQD